MKSDWKVSAPFVFVEVDGLGNSGTQIFDSFARYTQALEECVTSKLPEVIVKINQVVDEAENVQRRAEAQFESLDIVSKGKAVFAMSYNMKIVSKIPTMMKETLEDFKSDLEELK